MASNYNRKSAYSGSRNARSSSNTRSSGSTRSSSKARPSRTARSSGNRAARGRDAAAIPSRRPRKDSLGGASSRGSATQRRQPAARQVQSDSRLTSVRVGDLGAGSGRRQRSTRSSAPAFSPKIILPLAIVGAIIALLLVVLLVLRSSSAFTIENIEVNGADHLTSEEMMALINVPEGTTLLEVDTAAIEQSLLRDAWIESVDIVLSYPHTLKVNVTERGIRAVVEVPTEDGTAVKRWAVAQDGMWLMPIPDQDSEAGQRTSQQIYDDIANVLTITDVPYSTQPEMGTYCTDENVLNALEIVVGLTTDLSNQVKSVAAAEAETTVTLENGIEIAFGSSDDIRDKERVALMIMEENPGTLAYINVTNPKAPTWRSL